MPRPEPINRNILPHHDCDIDRYGRGARRALWRKFAAPAPCTRYQAPAPMPETAATTAARRATRRRRDAICPIFTARSSSMASQKLAMRLSYRKLRSCKERIRTTADF